jgi:hypothetical protein
LYDYNARYYDPTIGRFVSADSVVPGAGKPQALNRYAYVFNNRLKYTDPSGHCPRHDDECEELQWQTQQQYGIQMWGDWSKSDISALQDALELIAGKVGGVKTFRHIWAKTEFIRYHDDDTPQSLQKLCNGGIACTTGDTVRLLDNVFNRNAWYFKDTLAHELAHVWDNRYVIWNPEARAFRGEGISRQMELYTKSYSVPCYSQCRIQVLGPDGSTPLGSYATKNRAEDWARAFEIWVTGNKFTQESTYHPSQWQARRMFVETMVDLARRGY